MLEARAKMEGNKMPASEVAALVPVDTSIPTPEYSFHRAGKWASEKANLMPLAAALSPGLSATETRLLGLATAAHPSPPFRQVSLQVKLILSSPG